MAATDAGGQAVDGGAWAERAGDHGAGLAHGFQRRRGQRDGFAVPGGRDHLRNSQVTSVEHDRH
jgi:hypothetical protein